MFETASILPALSGSSAKRIIGSSSGTSGSSWQGDRLAVDSSISIVLACSRGDPADPEITAAIVQKPPQRPRRYNAAQGVANDALARSRSRSLIVPGCSSRQADRPET